MRLKNINGRQVKKNVSKYLIDWDSKSRSNIQYKVKQFLKEHWKFHIVYEEFPVYGTKLKVDFVNATKYIAIEVDGQQHDEYVKHFHKNVRGWINSIDRDMSKREWLELNEFQVINIYEKDIGKLSPRYIKNEFGINIA